MPICPLCESSQPAGESCDVCGRPFPAAIAVPVPIPTLAELEATHHPAAGHSATDTLDDLEPTAQRVVAALQPERVDGFEPTAAAPVQVEVAPLEVERVGGDAPPDEPWKPGPVVCRYCRTPAGPGQRLCASCGMRLSVERAPAALATSAPTPCRDCGIAMTGPQCPACGARRGEVR